MCRSQMNLCMQRAPHDVSMDHEEFIEGRASDRAKTSFAGTTISSIYQIRPKSDET